MTSVELIFWPHKGGISECVQSFHWIFQTSFNVLNSVCLDQTLSIAPSEPAGIHEEMMNEINLYEVNLP